MTEGTENAFVTGASGFLGQHLVLDLLSQCRQVFYLCRRRNGEEPAGIRIIDGALEDPESYRGSLNAGTTVFHLAAVRNRPGNGAAAMDRVNVTATLDLARAALRANVRRFVYVSTALVYGPSSGDPVAESKALPHIALDSTFLASRRRGLVEVRRLAGEGLNLVTVCPTIIFGPDRPSHPNRVAGHMRSLLRRGVSLVVAGGMQRRTLAFVDDVVHGILAAERFARAGEEFVLGGADVSHREFDRMVLRCAGRRPCLRVSLPLCAARPAARVADRVRGYDRGAGYEAALGMLSREWCYSSSAAEQRLGYPRTPIAEAIERTVGAMSG